MRSKTIWALVALNVMLLASLFFHNALTRSASAQALRAGRPSEYLMISGDVQGGSSGVIFMVDTRNGWLSARTMNAAGKLDDMPAIDLNRIFKQIK